MKVNDQRLRIKRALEALVEAQRHREFQRIAVHLAKKLWPEMQATEEQNDGGEDATSFVAGADGLRRSVAASLTGKLSKIKSDAGRIRARGVKLDALVFITPVPIDNLTAADWDEAIRKEFGHGLQIIPQAEVITLLEQPENRWLCAEYLGVEMEANRPVDELVAKARRISGEILSGWKAGYGYEEAKTIELTLVQLAAEGARKSSEGQRITIREICRLIADRRRGTLFGEPGAGKTFTLIQLADALLRDSSAPIPLLIPLSAWASSGKALFAFIETQFGRNDLKADDIGKLCSSGKVVLLLNGWNEVSDAAVGRTSGELKVLALNNPALPMVISTRSSKISPPLLQQCDIYVAALSHEQKSLIVEKSGLSNIAAFLTELGTNDALASITDTPLFLGITLSIARSGDPLPRTRHGVLKRFVEHIEENSEHSGALKEPPCKSFHRRYLEKLAVKMTQLGSTTLAFDEATRVVAECSQILRAEGHFEAVSNSADILDCLVRHHVLVLPPGFGSSYRFIHQQFQEWFAGESLRRRVAELANDDNAESAFSFQRDVLNHIHWQEPLYFLMEELAGGVEAEVLLAARVIRLSMAVSLSLASELAGAAGGIVWPYVRDDLGRALRRWYQQRSRDQRHCALTAMLATGAADFQDILWPLIESDDRNVRLFTHRMRRAFPFSCLGPDWRCRFSKWNPERKAEFIHEFHWGARREHIALASELAVSDEDAVVKIACFELLLDAGAFETIVGLTENWRFSDWPKGFVERLLTQMAQRFVAPILAEAKSAVPSIESFGARRAVILMLRRVNDPDWPRLVKGEMERMLNDSQLDFRPTNEYWNPGSPAPKPNATPFLGEYVSAMDEIEPGWAAAFVAELLAQGKFWWEPFTDFIRKMKDGDAQHVGAAALDGNLDVNTLRQRAVRLAEGGSLNTARLLLTAYLDHEVNANGSRNEPGLDRGDALREGVKALPINTLVDAVLAEASGARGFESARRLTELISQAPVIQASQDRKDALRSLVFDTERSKPMDFADQGWFRAELVDILGQVGIPEDVLIIEKWIADDIRRLDDESARWRSGFQAWEAGGRKGRPPVRVLSCAFWNNYQRALVQLGGQGAANVFVRQLKTPMLLHFASAGLYLLTCERAANSEPRFGERPDYVGVDARRQEQERGDNRNQTTKSYADAILGAIEHFRPEFQKERGNFPRHEILGALSCLSALNDLRALPFLEFFASDKYSAWAVTNALHTLILQGAVLSGDTVAAMLEPIIVENEKPQWGSNNDNWYMVVRALAVLLFSDQPSLGIARIRKLPEYRLRNYYVRDLLVLLGSCRVPEAVDLVVELALNPAVNAHYLYEVGTVLSTSPNPGAERGLITLFEKYCSGELDSRDAHSHLPRAFARAAKKGGRLWDEIRQRCGRPQSPRERQVLLCILNEIESVEAAICVCELIHDEFPVNYPAEHLVEEAATQKVPAGGSSYYIEPRDASDLKKRLINIAHSDVKRRASALHLLAVVERCRLEHGWPLTEARHPDIALLQKLTSPWELI